MGRVMPQCVALVTRLVWERVWHGSFVWHHLFTCNTTCSHVTLNECCSVLQCVAVCCSVLQCALNESCRLWHDLFVNTSWHKNKSCHTRGWVIWRGRNLLYHTHGWVTSHTRGWVLARTWMSHDTQRNTSYHPHKTWYIWLIRKQRGHVT